MLEKKAKPSTDSSLWKIGSCIFALAGTTAALTVLLTSDLTPVGRHIYSLLAKADDNPAGGGLHPYQVSLGIAVLLVFWGYLVDIHLWKSVSAPLVTGYSGILGLFFLAAVILYSTEAPSIPPLTGIGVGVWLVHQVRVAYFSHIPHEEFSYCSAAAYTVIGAVTIVVWLSWAFTPWMGTHTRDWVEPARASVDTENVIRWSSPFLQGLVYLIMALFLRWRSRMHTMNEYVLAELKLICSSFVLLFMFSWLAASVAAGDAGLSKVVLRLSTLLIIGAASYLIVAIGPETIYSAIESNEAFSLLLPLLTGDWAKGAVVLLCLPIFPVCLVLEMIHNFLRRLVRVLLMTNAEPGKHRWITDEAADMVESLCAWHISSVMKKGIWIGVIYFVLQVGCGRGIVVLLAWVCERSLHLPWAAVVFILYGIGVTLFLLPPVPGCPIYMVSAVLITKRFEAGGGHFLLASLLALVISMVIKLTAVAVEQKMIGEPFSNNIAVKKLVAIHTPEMKAIRYILSQNGLHSDKVLVLCCGPDWPTSVLTGVLKLPVFEMLLGTLPVAFLIMPFTLSGSFIVHASTLPEHTLEKRRFEGMSSALLFLSMLTQMGGMMLIFHCTHGVTERFKDEIAGGKWMRDDQEAEVLKDIEDGEERLRRRQEATRWEVLPYWVRADLLLGLTLMSVMMHIIMLPFLKPFKDFSLQDRFSDVADVYFLINPPGWVAIACLCCSVVCLAIFEAWVDKALDASGDAGDAKRLLSDGVGAARSYGGTSA